MKKITAVLTFVLMSAIPAWAISTLDIAADETYTVGIAQQRLSLSTLTIADGAKVVFAEGVSQWHVRAERASIGSNVVINGRGKAGLDGVGGDDGKTVASCQDGSAGGTGTTGFNGAKGISIRLQLGLQSFGDLQVLTDGGAGGAGGKGGDGSAAGRFGKSCKSAPVGGDAGAGGNGGNAGMAGDITLLYWPVNRSLDVSRVVNLVQVSAETGVKGLGGSAGKPGVGSKGRYVSKRTLTGNRSWVGGGDAGAESRLGVDGLASNSGRILVEQALVSAPRTVVQSSRAKTGTNISTASKAGRKQELQAIKQELRSLLQRLDQLESAE